MKKITLFFGIAFLLFSNFNLPSAFSLESWWNVYFTSPHYGKYYTSNNNPQKQFIKTIQSTKHSIDGAFYDISDKAVVKALIRGLLQKEIIFNVQLLLN